jgi:hypothetical protein
MAVNITERRVLEIIEDLKSNPDVDAICLLEAELHRRRKTSFGEADRGAVIDGKGIYDHRGYLICKVTSSYYGQPTGKPHCVLHKDAKGKQAVRYFRIKREATQFAIERVRQLQPSEYIYYTVTHHWRHKTYLNRIAKADVSDRITADPHYHKGFADGRACVQDAINRYSEEQSSDS